MARPKRTGLDYFPLDCNAGIDDEIELVEAEYGLEGFAIFIKLLQKIYKSGYYIEWTEKEQLQFSKRVNVDINRVNAYITTFCKWDLLSKTLFDTYNVLTSRGIQKRFLLAIDRRTSCEMHQEYLLLEEIEVNAYKNLVIVCKTHHNVDINPQSKVKQIESKEKESKVVVQAPATSLGVMIENAFGRLASPVEAQTLQTYIDDGMESELINKALEEASINGVRTMKYVKKILNRCIEENILTLDRYLIAQEDFKSKKSKSTQGDTEPNTDEMRMFLEED